MVIVDTEKLGHHEIYQNNLKKIKDISLIISEQKFNLKEQKIRYFLNINRLLNISLDKDVHFLTLDFLYKYPILKKLNKKRRVFGTLHKEPNSVFKFFLLKNFSKKINYIIVHSEFTKILLNNKGIKNVKLIEYPSFYDYSKIKNKKFLREKNKISQEKIILTSLGGTRYDKGLDILLESFKFLSSEIKDKLILNIAGKEETYKSDFISSKAKEYGINLMANYRFITDEEFMENIMITDIMMMPYRKIFGGNSGPMTEAVVNKIPCITPKGSNIGELTEKYNLGLTFECEDSRDLARVIEEMVNTKKEFFTTDYYKRLTVNNFIKRHKELYN